MLWSPIINHGRTSSYFRLFVTWPLYNDQYAKTKTRQTDRQTQQQQQKHPESHREHNSQTSRTKISKDIPRQLRLYSSIGSEWPAKRCFIVDNLKTIDCKIENSPFVFINFNSAYRILGLNFNCNLSSFFSYYHGVEESLNIMPLAGI